MKKLFERLANPGRSEPRLLLAAFGKHPGWDDHIPGIGLETESLARLKQTLYVEGIGRQIDSGAWEKLEVDKRYDDFNHSFLWLYPDRLVLGLIWSSTDRKGRSKYPMVLCVEGQGIPPAYMVGAVQPGLCRLRDACRATSSPEEVERLCRAAQEQLTAMLAGPAAGEHPGFTPIEERRQFVEHADNGPDRLGLLRLLHELSLVPSLISGRANDGGDASSRASEHLRLPLAARSAADSILLWGGFLVCSVADNVPVLVISRAGETYVEAIVGEPDPGDFFCLQSTPAAQPLVTTIPYQLGPTAPQDLEAVLARFLDSRPVPVPTTARPAASATASPAVDSKPDSSSSKLLWVGVGVALVALAAVAMLLSGRGKPRQNETPAPVPERAPPVINNPTPTQAVPNAAALINRFALATNESARALHAGDFSNALFHASQALALRPDDSSAADLKRKASEALLIASEVGKSSELNQSMARARAADKGEQWELAVQEYQRAVQLAEETKDNAAAIEAKGGVEFASIMAAMGAAMRAKDFARALAHADQALRLRPGHSTAGQWRQTAQAGKAEQASAAERQQAFQAATNAAAAALSAQDFSNAIAQADKALALNPGDAAAGRLRQAAENGIATLVQAERKRRLAQDLQDARVLLTNGDYAKTLALCASQPDEAEFKLLAATARGEQAALELAEKRLAAGEYAALLSLKTNGYSSKSAFASLLAAGAAEQQTLTALEAARQTNGWQVVRDRLAAAELASLAAKPPFAALRAWSEQQAKAATAAKPPPLEKLDEQLQVLLVRFNLLKPTAPNVTSARAREEKPFSGSLTPSNQQQILKSIDWLEQEFARVSALEQDDRQLLVQKLRERVRSWQ